MKPLNILVLMVSLLVPLGAGAATIEGKINGLKCATEGVICPIDKLDPMIAAESDFVLQLPDGSFYFMPNLDRGIKARYVLDEVRVSGDLNERYRSIDVNKLEVERDGGYRTVWSPELQATIWEDLAQPGASRP